MVRSPLVMAKPPRMNIGTLKKEKVLLNPKEAKSKIKLIQLHLHLVRGCPSQELQKWRKEGAQSEKQPSMCKYQICNQIKKGGNGKLHQLYFL